MESITQNFKNLIAGFCKIFVAIIIFMKPLDFATVVIVGTGIALIVFGSYDIFIYFRKTPEEAAKGQNFSKGMTSFGVGAFCIFRSQWFVMTFPVLAMLYGAVLLLFAAVSLQWTMDMFRQRREVWKLQGIGTLLAILTAIIVLVNPFSTEKALWYFMAIALLIHSITDLLIVFGKKRKEVELSK